MPELPDVTVYVEALQRHARGHPLRDVRVVGPSLLRTWGPADLRGLRQAAAIQRILYASRETNYCPACQTDGQVYADRVLSQLLRKDWPRTIEEWEQIRPARDPSP